MTTINLEKRSVLTFIALMILLGLTFLLAQFDLGPLNTPLGIFIAFIKMILVALFFMNLRQSDGIHRIFAMAGLFLLGVLVSLSMADFVTREWLALPGHFPQVSP